MATKSLASAVYDKVTRGGPLSDTEIQQGLAFYRDLSDKLIMCGPAFALAYAEARRIANSLEDFKIAREI